MDQVSITTPTKSDFNRSVQASQQHHLPTMDDRISWKPAMTRVLLDCVDEAAGNDTIFDTDRSAATEMVMTRLRPLVTDPQMYARLNQIKIYNKLSKQAQSGGVQRGGFKEFLQVGTKCLDLSSLQPETYSQAEIHASSQHRQSDNKSELPISKTRSASKKAMREIVNEPSKVRKSGTQKGEDEDSNKRRKRPHSSAFSQDPEQAQVPAKRKRTTIKPASFNDEISDSQSSGNESDDDYADDYADASENLERDSQSRFARVPSTISQAQAQAQAVYVCEFCEEYFHAKKDLLDHKSSHERSSPIQNASQSSFQISTTEGMARLTPGELNLLELATSRCGNEHTDVDIIRSAMASIQADIFDTTKLFLTNLKIDSNEILELRVNSYQEPLNELLRVVFGSGPIDRLAQSKNVRFPSVSGIKRREIILATIGCAVTEWALGPLPQGEVRDGVLGEMNKLLQARSPIFQDRVMEMATHQYLEEHVKPLAQGFAQVFAHDLFRLLRHFLPGKLQQVSSQRPSNIHTIRTDTSSGQNTMTAGNVPPEIPVATTSRSLPARDEQQTFPTATVKESRANVTSEYEPTSSQPALSEITSSDSAFMSSDHARRLTGWPPKAQKDPTRIFLQSLGDIFTSALRLRLDMEIKGNAKYEFLFPLRGTTLDLKQLVAHNKANNRKIQIPDLELLGMADQQVLRKVHLGLTPIVRGRFRKGDRGGEWREDPILISKGCVHIQDV